MSELFTSMQRVDLTLEDIQSLNKGQWVILAEELDLEFKKSSKKDKIAMIVVEKMIETDVFKASEDEIERFCEWLEELHDGTVVSNKLSAKEKAELRMKEEEMRERMKREERLEQERVKMEREKNEREKKEIL